MYFTDGPGGLGGWSWWSRFDDSRRLRFFPSKCRSANAGTERVKKSLGCGRAQLDFRVPLNFLFCARDVIGDNHTFRRGDMGGA
jgi:hypothetical protein